MTASTLRNYTCKDLAQMARSQGVTGWHAMRKDELVRAILKQARRKRSSSLHQRRNDELVGSKPGNLARTSAEKLSSPSNKVRERLGQLQAKMEASRDLASKGPKEVEKDRLVVMVRGPYWLHVYWELTTQTVERAQSAMGQYWHTAQPTLRVYCVSSDGTSSLLEDIAIHGGVSHWYVNVQDPPSQFRMEVGYCATNGKFHCLARSNTVKTPSAGASDSFDENWADVDENADRIFAMSGGYTPQGMSLELQELLEERLRRPMGSPMQTRYGNGAARVLASTEDLPFAVDAELIVYGVSHPSAHVTLQGEPVVLRSDGSFTVRMPLGDRRQVIPVVASSPDGGEQRTIILAVERNTKLLEPVLRDLGQ